MTLKMRLNEILFNNIPDIDIFGKNKPPGWFFNTTDQYSKFKFKRIPKRAFVFKNPKKVWDFKNLTKLKSSIVDCLKQMKPYSKEQNKEERPGDEVFLSSYCLQLLFS